MSTIVRQFRRSFSTCLGEAPARITVADGGPPVLLLHGLSASKEAQDKEAVSLARAGFTAVAVDAPHHGERRSPLLDDMSRASGDHAHALLLRMVHEAARELPELIAELGGSGDRVGVVGISMGAYTALGAFVHDPRPDVTAALLGSPDWTPASGLVCAEIEKTIQASPTRNEHRFPPHPLLLANAGRDAIVRPEGSRRFVDRLRARYLEPDRLRYLEFPHSEHFMREQDWDALWAEVLAFARRWLIA